MNNQLRDLKKRFGPVVKFTKQYLGFILLIGFLACVGFMVLKIDQLSSVEPTDDQVTEKLNDVKRPTIDQNAIDKIQQLQDQNIDVKTLYDQARSNPFNE